MATVEVERVRMTLSDAYYWEGGWYQIFLRFPYFGSQGGEYKGGYSSFQSLSLTDARASLIRELHHSMWKYGERFVEEPW